MAQVLHQRATTTHAIRAAIQRSTAPLKELAARCGLNRKTVGDRPRPIQVAVLLAFPLTRKSDVLVL